MSAQSTDIGPVELEPAMPMRLRPHLEYAGEAKLLKSLASCATVQAQSTADLRLSYYGEIVVAELRQDVDENSHGTPPHTAVRGDGSEEFEMFHVEHLAMLDVADQPTVSTYATALQ